MGTTRKDIIRELYLSHINKHDLSKIDQFVSSDYLDLTTGGQGLDVYRNNLQTLLTGFPDIVFTIKEIIEEGEKVVLRWEWRGTHLGHFAKTAPTSRVVTNVGVVIFTFQAEKIIDSWTLVDRLAVMQQVTHSS